ncbi:L-threonine 3-O-phosphate decarboxylase [Citrifermentans bremense]|uniref:threonine-phosphate decarboxylase n=1 Tax=Citrifermentans bremense TaxID=60035 RepID=A0A6S6M2S1_9BACT|nr:threonine-phosphate decarboxylase CobD [Citrifermentans bremense]BCG48707.1 L-threonine 3-O-phosphate decarboxylase [Citrifermentans bremense]
MSKKHEHGGNVFAVARMLGVAPEQILDFSASINPLGMSPGVRDALTGCLDRLLHYPDKGAAELRERIAAYHGIRAEEILPASGSTELIHLLPRVVGGRKGLIVAPAFAEYAEALDRAGWEIDYLTLSSADNFALPLPLLWEKLGEGVDMVFICNPGNPTGALVPRREMETVVELCREHGTFLVLDEAFMDFCEEESAKELIRHSPRAVLLRSMTKFFAIPGLRLGYAIAAPETVEAIAALQDPWSVNTAAQVAGVAALMDAGYCARTREYVDAERERLARGLSAIPGLRVFPSRANYLLVEICDGRSARELRERLTPEGVLVRDCGNFEGLDGRFFRVAVRLREENERLLELLGKK